MMKKSLLAPAASNRLETYLSRLDPSGMVRLAFPAVLSPSEQKAERTGRVARDLIGGESRQATTARLRTARLEKKAGTIAPAAQEAKGRSPCILNVRGV